MSDIITKRSEEFKELTDWMVQTTREIETAMKHLRPTIGQEHYLTGDEICRRFHVCKRTLQTLRDTKAIPYTTLGGKNPLSRIRYLRGAEEKLPRLPALE
jgi:hypothetical protein